MKHDKDAIEHSFGVGSGIPARHSDRSSNLRIRPELLPPRPWPAMLGAWGALTATLCAVLGVDPGDVRLRRDQPWLAAWSWMWTLPPCSMARKAAFTLGHAALLIERWRSCVSKVPFRPDDGFPLCNGYMVGPDDGKTTLETSEENARALPAASAIGQRAEALLRILAWQTDDARGEAHTKAQGGLPCGHLPGFGMSGCPTCGAPASGIPPHERVYERRAGIDSHVEIGPFGVPTQGAGWEGRRARAILKDHLISGPPVPLSMERMRTELPRLEQAFAETAIASLPDGPWTMTSEDVSRFLDMILEDAPMGTVRA